jgi:hypothetical protein
MVERSTRIPLYDGRRGGPSTPSTGRNIVPMNSVKQACVIGVKKNADAGGN